MMGERQMRDEYHKWDKEFCTDTSPTYWECWEAACVVMREETTRLEAELNNVRIERDNAEKREYAVLGRASALELELKATQARLDMSDELLREEFAQRQDALAPTPPSVPRPDNCGRHYAIDNTGQWHYINHAGTWQACPCPVPSVPDGWVLVPAEPTPAMLDALRTGSRKDWPSDELCRVRYAALVTAAPKPRDE